MSHESHSLAARSPAGRLRKPFDPQEVLTQFKRATTLLFRRRMPADPGFALGAESAMPGLEVSDSTWAEWEAALQAGPAGAQTPRGS